ncbi:MAG: alpha/beta hydrolase [bacterium]|nr:alpha/beta hydrolase [bacterium]
MKPFLPCVTGGAASVLALALLLATTTALAGPLRDAFKARHAAADNAEEDGDTTSRAALPTGVRVLRDIAYGSDPKQTMDVYLPPNAKAAPVIFMVHGGAWRLGDKASATVVDHKVARWLPQGFVFISVNYRLLPAAAPLQQAEDVAAALAVAQGKAADWGADRHKFILMGHSAGAHLVALLAAAPAMALQRGASPWLGTVALDSAALDVVQIMENRHMGFYDNAFGKDPDYWRAVSPLQSLHAGAAPVLAVCSSQRDDSCPQAQRFSTRAAALGIRASVLPEGLSHKDINRQLGLPDDYTRTVEAFMATLDAGVRQHLTTPQAMP